MFLHLCVKDIVTELLNKICQFIEGIFKLQKSFNHKSYPFTECNSNDLTVTQLLA